MNEAEKNIQNKEFIEVRIIDLFVVLNEAKKFILIIVFIGFLLSLYSALSATKVYHSNSVLAEAESQRYPNGGNRGNSFITSLVSVSSPSTDKYSISRKYLTSRDFFRILYNDADFLQQLMFSKSYNPKTSSMTFFEMDPVLKPSFEKSYEAYLSNVSINFNDRTGFTEILTKHMSPHVAKNWNEKIIKNINSYQKNKEIVEAEKSLTYFQQRLNNSENNFILLKDIYSAGISSDLQTLSMASKTDEFAFTIVDSPYLPERASEPSRRLILLLGTFVSLIVSFILVIIIYFSKNFCKFSPRN